MKTITILLAFIVSAATFAETNSAPKRTKSPGGANRLRMRLSGGMLQKPGSAQGKVVFLNAQKRVPDAALRGAIDEIDRRIHPMYETRTAESVDLGAVQDAVRSTGAQLGVVIVDVATGTPALLVAPEEGWAVVNVAKLAVGSPAQKVLESRVRKEVLRAFALVGGGAFMAADPIVVRSDVRTAADLDLIKDEMYGIDVCRAISMNLPGLGVTPWRVVTYRVACQEGWAHSPTNQYQKKIWDKVHQLPTNPLPLVKPTK